MSEHYAVCLSVSQGVYDTRASAHLLHVSGDRETMMRIEWPVLPPETQPENAGEWLFNVLSDLVANFDAHQVVNAETGPRGSRQGAGNGS
jgi:hypothetical protein